MMDLTEAERTAFTFVQRAYAELTDTPVDSPIVEHRRGIVRHACFQWARALADLDRSMSRPELREAA